ncbi:MAG: hypothetical protein PHS46_08095 [Candidatus Omnitrophica bacterium]|nr:hypothetical protein [Candidatus Omnitrophota bacterium]
MRIINESDARIAELERDNARLSTALSGEHPFATTIALATCKEIATKLVEAVEARHRIGYGLTFNRYSDQKKMQEHSAACEREKEAIERWHKEMGR